MTKNTFSLDEIRESYDKFIDECARFNFYTRSKKIQEEKINECEKYILMLKGFKSQAIEKQNEQDANLLFHFQCMINSIAASLKLWILLKDENYHGAWCSLVDAQDYINVALKIRDYPGIRNMESQLKAMETALFPGWTYYNSPGHTETVGKCSICNVSFMQCDHIENQIYLGRLCQRIDREIVEAHHSALVKNPKDRRCILTKISDDHGKMIDYFTWEETGEKNKDDNNMYIEGVLLSFHYLDFN